MNTIIKVLVFLVRLGRLQPFQSLVAALSFTTSFSWWSKLITKLSIPQLFRKPTPKNPFITKKKS